MEKKSTKLLCPLNQNQENLWNLWWRMMVSNFRRAKHDNITNVIQGSYKRKVIVCPSAPPIQMSFVEQFPCLFTNLIRVVSFRLKLNEILYKDVINSFFDECEENYQFFITSLCVLHAVLFFFGEKWFDSKEKKGHKRVRNLHVGNVEECQTWNQSQQCGTLCTQPATRARAAVLPILAVPPCGCGVSERRAPLHLQADLQLCIKAPWHWWQAPILWHSLSQDWVFKSRPLKGPTLFHLHSLSAIPISLNLRFLLKCSNFLVSTPVGQFHFLVWTIKLRRRASPLAKPPPTAGAPSSKFIPGDSSCAAWICGLAVLPRPFFLLVDVRFWC